MIIEEKIKLFHQWLKDKEQLFKEENKDTNDTYPEELIASIKSMFEDIFNL